jgi:hypothetical protein
MGGQRPLGIAALKDKIVQREGREYLSVKLASRDHARWSMCGLTLT